MRIERVGVADTERIRACHEEYLAAERIDSPEGPWLGEGPFRTWLTVGWEDTPQEVWAAIGDSVVGWYRLMLPALTNVDRARLDLTVHPAARRHGIGRALLRHAAGRAAAHGRTKLGSTAQQGSPGEAFARCAGAELDLLVEIKRVMEIGTGTKERLARLREPAERAAAGYSLVSWDGVVAEEFLEQAAALYTALNDAPHSPGIDPEVWDGQRVRDHINAPRIKRSLHDYSVAARHDATGVLAALTEIAVDPADPRWGYQMITVVIGPHRGHRLGLLVKLGMLDVLAAAEPGLDRIVTWNAQANDHMIAVNEALGYAVAGQPGASCQVDVAAVLDRARLGSRGLGACGTRVDRWEWHRGWWGDGGMGFAGGMGIERLEVAGDAGRVRECFEIFLAARRADDPSGPPLGRTAFEGWLSQGWVSDPRETWFLTGEDGGAMVGWCLLELPRRDNRHLAGLELLVAPGRRGHGFGTALLRHAAERAIADGRGLLNGYAWQDSAGAAFARSVGATGGMVEIRRALRLGAAAAGRFRRLRTAAEPAAASYSVIGWTGPVPEEHLAQVAAINTALADAPHDANLQPARWDAARVRDADRRIEQQMMRAYTLVARHEASGELAGLTQLEVSPEAPSWGFQGLTAVIRAHRGHRLGLLLKVAMLERMAEAEPRLKRIVTVNAETNTYMVSINEALGFKPLGKPAQSWELPAADVLGRP